MLCCVDKQQEFPFLAGVEDLLVLSVGPGQFDRTYNYEKARRWGADQWGKPVITIVGDGISDTVDHAISLAFGQSRHNYVRIQGNGFIEKCMGDTDDSSEANVKMLIEFADIMMKQKSMENENSPSAMQSNSNGSADELVCEHRSRLSRLIPTVLLKQVTRSP